VTHPTPKPVIRKQPQEYDISPRIDSSNRTGAPYGAGPARPSPKLAARIQRNRTYTPALVTFRHKTACVYVHLVVG
jgi:hypothetical protein